MIKNPDNSPWELEARNSCFESPQDLLEYVLDLYQMPHLESPPEEEEVELSELDPEPLLEEDEVAFSSSSFPATLISQMRRRHLVHASSPALQ